MSNIIEITKNNEILYHETSKGNGSGYGFPINKGSIFINIDDLRHGFVEKLKKEGYMLTDKKIEDCEYKPSFQITTKTGINQQETKEKVIGIFDHIFDHIKTSSFEGSVVDIYSYDTELKVINLDTVFVSIPLNVSIDIGLGSFKDLDIKGLV